MRQSFCYKRVRPLLTIEVTGGRELGRCYYATDYRLTSTDRLTKDQVAALRAAGFLGHGQEFLIHSPADGSEAPAGFDETPCQVLDPITGKVLPDVPAVNPLTGAAYSPLNQPFYSYDCESRVDSSD